MIAHIFRLIVGSVPIVLGVNVLTFALFFFVNPPEDMARKILGDKHVTEDAIEDWVRGRGYHLPLFWNSGWNKLRARTVRPEGAVFQPKDVTRGDYRIDVTNRLDRDLVFDLDIQSPGAWDSRADAPFEGAFPATGAPRSPPESPAADTLRGLRIGPRGSRSFYIRIFRDGALGLRILPEDPGGGAASTALLAKARLSSYEAASGLRHVTRTVFFRKGLNLLWFDFGHSDQTHEAIGYQIVKRIGPSMAVALPTFIIGTLVYLTCAMLLAFFRGSYLDFYGLVLFVLAMSISSLFYIIGGQVLFGLAFKLVPISGYDTGWQALKFVALPVVVGVTASIGAQSRFYRTIFLEEIHKDYIRTARAKGLGEGVVLFKHALKNAMIPVLTSVVMILPFLFMGSLVTEAFFSIPGLGSYTYDAINQQDFSVVRVMVYLSSLMYITGLLLTDISYTLVDPRVSFE